MPIQEDFNAAVTYVRGLPKDGPVTPSNSEKLRFYSTYKQATEGKCNTDRPGILSPFERAKWDAWNALGDMPKEEAMQAYLDQLNLLKSRMN